MLKIAQKIKNGECPVLCFFGDSITDGQFEFANGHKESVRHEEWVFWNILRNRIREEIGQEVSIVNAGVGGNFSKDGLARIQQDVLERKPDFCCVMFGTNDVTNAYSTFATWTSSGGVTAANWYVSTVNQGLVFQP